MDLFERWIGRRYWPAAAPLEKEDPLQERLLSIPPQPSSLACSHFDPEFLPGFSTHNCKLLGFFYQDGGLSLRFTPMLDPLDNTPMPENMVDCCSPRLSFIGCRHGIALLLDHSRQEAVLWDPITGGQRRVAFPQGLGNGYQIQGQRATMLCSAAVLCSAGDDHRHLCADCGLSTFKLVMVLQDKDTARNKTKTYACLYESRSQAWGDIISTTSADAIANVAKPSVMVGNALYWLLSGANILEFDIENHTLVVIKKPSQYAHITGNDVCLTFQILRREDNVLGLAVLSLWLPIIKLWARGSNSDGVVSWALQKTIQLDEFISRRLPCEKKTVRTIGYDEDTNVIFLSTISHDFILHLESKQFRYIGRREFFTSRNYYPYTNFCTAVKSFAGGDGVAENVNT